MSVCAVCVPFALCLENNKYTSFPVAFFSSLFSGDSISYFFHQISVIQFETFSGTPQSLYISIRWAPTDYHLPWTLTSPNQAFQYTKPRPARLSSRSPTPSQFARFIKKQLQIPLGTAASPAPFLSRQISTQHISLTISVPAFQTLGQRGQPSRSLQLYLQAASTFCTCGTKSHHVGPGLQTQAWQGQIR